MKSITMGQAIAEAMEEEMLKDNEIFLIGEDIGPLGGSFGVTQGMYEKFPDRVLDTPIAETGIMGIALGAAYAGMKTIPELMFADFIGVVFDYLMNQATRNRYMTGMQEGGKDCCMVVRTPNGGGIRAGAQHSQTVEQYLMPIPGLKIVAPSTPADAKGLMKAALRQNDPVVFLENKLLNFTPGDVPEEEYVTPIGVADVKREGKDVTVIATQMMVHKALGAAEELAKNGIEVEVIDPRTIKPLDMETIMTSVRKTGRVVLTNEAPVTGNIMSEIASLIVEEGFDILKTAPVKVCGPDTPIPFAPALEDEWLVSPEQIAAGVMKAMGK